MELKNYLSSTSVDPQKILKIVLAFAAIMLVLWLIMISRMDFDGENDTADQITQNRTDSLRIALNKEDLNKPSTEQRSSNIFLNAFTTFIVLITILGLVWFWSRKKPATSQKTDLKEIGDHMLGQGAQLKIVEINEEIWVMGVTSNNVTLLHRYPRDEWTGTIKNPESDDKSFYQMFRRNT